MPSHAYTAAATPEGVGTLRNAVAAYAAEHGMSEARLADLRLGVSEVVTNAIVHGYQGERRGSVRATVQVTRDEVIVTVVDQGVGLKPAAQHNHMGLPLVEAITEDLEIESRAEGGTRARLVFSRRGD